MARSSWLGSGLDPSFGNDAPKSGRTLLTQAHEDEVINALAVRDDGKIVVAGQAIVDNHSFYALTGRFAADGTGDSSCNGQAYSRVDFGRAMDGGSAVAIGPGDKAYLAGTVFGTTNLDYGLVRFKEDCSVDDTGGLQLPVPEYKFAQDLGGDDYVAGMVLQGAKAVIAGQSGTDIVLIRTTQDLVRGFVKLDTSFGTGGKATLHSDTVSYSASHLTQQSDGGLLVAGQVFDGGSIDDIVVRFSADGQLDTTFGQNGVARVDFAKIDGAPAIAVRSDDAIAIASCVGAGSGTRFAVAQLTKAGQLDSGFHGDGKITLQFGQGGDDCADAVAFVGNNRIVAGGFSDAYGQPQCASRRSRPVGRWHRRARTIATAMRRSRSTSC